MVQSTLVTVVIDWLLQSIINFINLVVKKIKEGREGGGGAYFLPVKEGGGASIDELRYFTTMDKVYTSKLIVTLEQF